MINNKDKSELQSDLEIFNSVIEKINLLNKKGYQLVKAKEELNYRKQLVDYEIRVIDGYTPPENNKKLKKS